MQQIEYKLNKDNFYIGFFSNLMGSGRGHGYGYAAIKLIEAWQRLQVPVWGHDPAAPVIFNFVQPQWYNYQEDKPCIGYTPWESTALPPMWPFYMNYQSEIWTTSQACKQWFLEGGVTSPIRVLPHGIDRMEWPIARRRIGKDGLIHFLHVGAESQRKGARRAYEAFRAAFPNTKDVRLTIKGQPNFYIDDPRVRIERKYLEQHELTQLYLDHHAMIYPTNGEGFGLIPFQAAATGMPTWVTDWSGPQDYMRYCEPIAVERLIEPDYVPHIGLWAQPSHDDLVDRLRGFYSMPEYFFGKHYRLAGQMDKSFSWDYIALESLNWLRELVAS